MRLSDIVCLQICRLPNRKTHGKFTETILGKGVHKKVEKYGLLTNPPQPVSYNIESIGTLAYLKIHGDGGSTGFHIFYSENIARIANAVTITLYSKVTM